MLISAPTLAAIVTLSLSATTRAQFPPDVSSPAALNSNAASDSEGDEDIFESHSTDDAATWSNVALLNSNATTDSGNDQNPDVATDTRGNWVAVWQSDENLSGAGPAKPTAQCLQGEMP